MNGCQPYLILLEEQYSYESIPISFWMPTHIPSQNGWRVIADLLAALKYREIVADNLQKRGWSGGG